MQFFQVSCNIVLPTAAQEPAGTSKENILIQMHENAKI
mgnify:CR=1 FL=1